MDIQAEVYSQFVFNTVNLTIQKHISSNKTYNSTKKQHLSVAKFLVTKFRRIFATTFFFKIIFLYNSVNFAHLLLPPSQHEKKLVKRVKTGYRFT